MNTAASPERVLEVLHEFAPKDAALARALEAARIRVRLDAVEGGLDAYMPWAQRMGYTVNRLLTDLAALELAEGAQQLVAEGREEVGQLVLELYALFGREPGAAA